MSDYYPYGLDMPGRTYMAEVYRYGYQGSEREPETLGGAGYTTFFRALDPRIGRWLTPDPKIFPWQSPYCSMDCNPVAMNDPWGAASEGGPKTRTNKDGSVDEYSRNGNTDKDEWHQIVPPMSAASTTINSVPRYKPVSDYSYLSEPARYGYSKSLESYKAEFGFEGTHAQVYQQWKEQHWVAWNEAVKQWDKEESQRKTLAKLEWFLMVYQYVSIGMVPPGFNGVKGLQGSSKFNLNVKNNQQADNIVNLQSSKSNLKLQLSAPVGGLRLRYMGATPGKSSRTGREVIQRMRQEGKIREMMGECQFQASDGMWYSLDKADMAHVTDAVTFWNSVGRFSGVRSSAVRSFMLNSDNYYLELFSINRSQGARLGVTYLPPAN